MRYFIGFLVTIGLIILVIVLLFGGGSKSAVPSTTKSLYSYYNTDAEVRMTIDGPINADQNHQSLQITVSNEDAQIQLFQGYNGTVTSQNTYPTSQNLYGNFLSSLAYAGFTKGDTTASLQNDEGYCPLGDRYQFQLLKDGKTLESFWTTSCGGAKTYEGGFGLTTSLFEAQIPDYNSMTSNFDF